MGISTHHLAEFLSSSLRDSGTGTIVIVAAKVSERIKDTATQTFTLVSTGSWYVTPLFPDSGTNTFVIAASGSDKISDRNTGIIVIVGSGTQAIAEAGTNTFLIFTEGHSAVGIFNVKQDRIYNVQIK